MCLFFCPTLLGTLTVTKPNGQKTKLTVEAKDLRRASVAPGLKEAKVKVKEAKKAKKATP